MAMSDPSTQEAIQLLIGSILVEHRGRDDHEVIPWRSIFEQMGRDRGIDVASDLVDVPERETMGWMRGAFRSMLASLAAGNWEPPALSPPWHSDRMFSSPPGDQSTKTAEREEGDAPSGNR